MDCSHIVSRIGKCGTLAVILLASLASLTGAASASAQPVPALCLKDAKLVAKYNNGLSAGQQKAEAFYASSDVGKNQKKLRQKLNRVLERLHDQVRDGYHQDTRDNRRCRLQGVADGFLSRLAQLAGECILDGAQWGQFSAELYCELSAELGGLAQPDSFTRAPAGLCGTLFEQTCDGVYAYVATEGAAPLASSIKKFASDRGVTVTTYPGCREFTTGAFETVFESSVETDCTYQ